jgi:hypothetical protein
MRNGWSFLLVGLLLAPSGALADSSADEFFEKEVRPLLANRCQKCHGDKDAKGGLHLTSRAALLKGGDTGPAVVAGKPDDSLLVQAIRYKDSPRMPPKEKLSDRDIATLTRWVQLGAPWPSSVEAPIASGTKFQITEEQRRFWAFQPVRPAALPVVKNSAWPRSGIDRFILARLEARGLSPAQPADKRTLIRRATFDLTGLPPTPEAIDAFLRDNSADAYARVLDRLLVSPAYGERWGRHWLDVVRYADCIDNRFIGGPPDVNDIWRYRDWVVDSFNRDLAYDRFLRMQIAGDLLPVASEAERFASIVATGMLAIGRWEQGEADKEKMMTDIVDDQIDVVGRALLGLTIACARCHDHKFDPISNADYYALAGIFFSSHVIPDPGSKTGDTRRLRVPLASQAEVDRRRHHAYEVQELERLLKEQSSDPAELAAALQTLKDNAPAPLPTAHGILEGGVPTSMYANIGDARIHIRGSYTRLGDVVPRRFPNILAGEKQPAITQGSGRLELAQWIASPQNPLTARVMVNRLWQHHFGEGIVRTSSNFGKLGERPTHPELLDYLADQFVKSGWSVKAMHRAMMLSATYQQSAVAEPRTLEADRDNRGFGRMNRRRLESEALRDSLLAVAGKLDGTMGGPAMRDFNSPRRTLYQLTVRSDRSGFGPLFDVADPTASVERRTVSTVAPQALFLLNHPFALEQAKAVAKRLGTPERGQEKARIEQAYGLLYGRLPEAAETQIGVAFLSKGALEQAWQDYCHVLLCANEFMYVD